MQCNSWAKISGAMASPRTRAISKLWRAIRSNRGSRHESSAQKKSSIRPFLKSQRSETWLCSTSTIHTVLSDCLEGVGWDEHFITHQAVGYFRKSAGTFL